MADSRGTTGGRIDYRDGRPVQRRVSRLAVVLIFAGVIGVLALASPRALTTVHVGINAVSGLVWLVGAVLTRNWPERWGRVPFWLVCLALSAVFLGLAFVEARDRLG